MSADPLLIRLNALLYAYVREETIVQGQPMTREEIIAEIQAIAVARDKAKNEEQSESSV